MRGNVGHTKRLGSNRAVVGSGLVFCSALNGDLFHHEQNHVSEFSDADQHIKHGVITQRQTHGHTYQKCEEALGALHAMGQRALFQLKQEETSTSAEAKAAAEQKVTPAEQKEEPEEQMEEQVEKKEELIEEKEELIEEKEEPVEDEEAPAEEEALPRTSAPKNPTPKPPHQKIPYGRLSKLKSQLLQLK